MYRLLFTLIAGILGLTTIGICALQPQMHKTFFVYNSDYVIVEPADKVEVVKNLPAQVNQPQKEEKKVTVQKVVKSLPKTTQKPVEKKSVKNSPQPVQKIQTSQQTVNPLLSMLKETSTTESAQQKVVEKNVQTAPQSVKKEETKPAAKTVTEEEKARQEVILWNKWRSNLQNKIMSDVKLPIMPEGTIFKFSFDVDKYGKISNVKTWSLTPAYTPYAIQYIAPVIRGYQGRDILNFPEGSNRFSTTVEGGWKISQTAKFSTPEDFKDAEKVIIDKE